MSNQFSSQLREGFPFLWWRPSLNTNLTPTIRSEYTGHSAPDPLLEGFAWLANGLFLGASSNISINPNFTEEEQTVDLVDVPTDVFYGNQSYSISAELAYNANPAIMDLGLLPGNRTSYSRTDGARNTPEEGTLVILLSNHININFAYRDIILVLVFYRMRAIPQGIGLKKGHSTVKVGFKSLAGKDIDGCFLGVGNRTSFIYATLLTDPTTMFNLDGSPINTTPDNPIPLANNFTLLNID